MAVIAERVLHTVEKWAMGSQRLSERHNGQTLLVWIHNTSPHTCWSYPVQRWQSNNTTPGPIARGSIRLSASLSVGGSFGRKMPRLNLEVIIEIVLYLWRSRSAPHSYSSPLLVPRDLASCGRPDPTINYSYRGDRWHIGCGQIGVGNGCWVAPFTAT